MDTFKWEYKGVSYALYIMMIRALFEKRTYGRCAHVLFINAIQIFAYNYNLQNKNCTCGRKGWRMWGRE
jgi:hypothetical protein